MNKSITGQLSQILNKTWLLFSSNQMNIIFQMKRAKGQLYLVSVVRLFSEPLNKVKVEPHAPQYFLLCCCVRNNYFLVTWNNCYEVGKRKLFVHCRIRTELFGKLAQLCRSINMRFFLITRNQASVSYTMRSSRMKPSKQAKNHQLF